MSVKSAAMNAVNAAAVQVLVVRVYISVASATVGPVLFRAFIGAEESRMLGMPQGY